MKKYNAYFVLVILFLALFYSCSGSKNESANTDAIGEADTLSPNRGRASKNIVKATLNGKAMEFSFVGSYNNDTFNISESQNGAYTMWAFELGTNEQMKEKISISLVNHDITKEAKPFIIKGKQTGKQARLDLSIQKSNIFIPYSNVDSFDCAITNVSDQEVEGTFSGEVKNLGNRVIKIENGSFRIQVKKVEMKLQ